MPTKILSCKPACKHKYQDDKYGEGKRVYNQTRQQEGKTWKCSVCENTQNVGGDEKDSKKKK